MRKFANLFIAAAVAMIFVSCTEQPQYANRAEKILAEINDPNSEYVVVISHRGDWRNYPENSIPAIESIIRMGADMMELLLLLALHPTIHLLRSSIVREVHALNHKKVLIMHHILRINRIRGTFAEREIIYRIQQVGLPHPVLSDETIHLVREIQLHLLQVFIIQNRNLL